VKRIALALAGLAFAAAALFGQQSLAEGKWWKRPRIAKELQLTPAQTAELEKIFAKSRPKLIDLKAEFEKKQFAYEQAMSAEKVDRALVESSIGAREQARAKLQTEISLMELDMKQVLTPEQWTRLTQMREEARDRRRQMRSEPSGQRP
jgi:Spy/CpxP family protein refolding chaperone